MTTPNTDNKAAKPAAKPVTPTVKAENLTFTDIDKLPKFRADGPMHNKAENLMLKDAKGKVYKGHVYVLTMSVGGMGKGHLLFVSEIGEPLDNIVAWAQPK